MTIEEAAVSVWNFKHLDLMEISGRLDPSRPVSARGKTYLSTEPGQADFAAVCTAHILRQLWQADSGRALRISDIEAEAAASKVTIAARIPASLKRLARSKIVALDFDRDGVIVKQGPDWIET